MPIATLLRRTSGTAPDPPYMCRALAIWLKTWSAATHMKSAYMNSTTGDEPSVEGDAAGQSGEGVLADRGAEHAIGEASR